MVPERSDAYQNKIKGWTLSLDKYEWAAAKLQGTHNRRLIADAPCGTGAGTDFLSKCGYHAIGFDNSPDALWAARDMKYEGAFVLADIGQQTFAGFEAVVCIGGIELLDNPVFFLHNLQAPELVIEHHPDLDTDPWVEHCKHRWTVPEFEDMLQQRFSILDVLNQTTKHGERLNTYYAHLRL